MPEFRSFHPDGQTAIMETIPALQEYGPVPGQPQVDTLKGSRYSNMKELRRRATGGHWRLAFTFDSERAAILLAAADKSGGPPSTGPSAANPIERD